MSDTPSIPPALTPEEWVPRVDPDIYPGQVIEAGSVERRDDGTIILGCDLAIDRPHATAALCLYGQPFGFTHDEVQALAVLPEWLDFLEKDECPKCGGQSWKCSAPPICIGCGWKLAMHPHSVYHFIQSLAPKIAALLPPGTS